MTDADIVRAFRHAHETQDRRAREQAWKQFYTQFARVIDFRVRTLTRHFRRGDDAEDCIQQVYLKLAKDDCRPLREFALGQAQMKTWLITICTNVCLSRVRAHHPTVPLHPHEPDSGSGARSHEFVDGSRDEVDTLLERTEIAIDQIHAIALAVNGLDDAKRLFFITKLLGLVAFDRPLTITEIGQLYGVSAQHAKYKLDRGAQIVGQAVRASAPGLLPDRLDVNAIGRRRPKAPPHAPPVPGKEFP